MLEGVIPLETFLLVEWHYGELADVPSFTVLKTQICVTRPQCVKLLNSNTLKVGFHLSWIQTQTVCITKITQLILCGKIYGVWWTGGCEGYCECYTM